MTGSTLVKLLSQQERALRHLHREAGSLDFQTKRRPWRRASIRWRLEQILLRRSELLTPSKPETLPRPKVSLLSKTRETHQHNLLPLIIPLSRLKSAMKAQQQETNT